MAIVKKLGRALTFWHPYADKLQSVALLFARITVGRVFLMSGLQKWNGPFKFNPDTYDLFLYEFFCPDDIRKGALYLCDAKKADYTSDMMTFVIERFANIAGIFEVLCGVTLILGLMGRLSALVLLGMTLFIQFFVFPDSASWWGSHAWWTACLLVVVAYGSGVLSLDKLFKLDQSKP
jgi:putative oxidoreductase